MASIAKRITIARPVQPFLWKATYGYQTELRHNQVLVIYKSKDPDDPPCAMVATTRETFIADQFHATGHGVMQSWAMAEECERIMDLADSQPTPPRWRCPQCQKEGHRSHVAYPDHKFDF